MQTITLLNTGALDNWRDQMINAITSVDELLRELELEHLRAGLDRSPGFRLQVPRAYVRKMQKRNPEDPLLKQVLPLTAEDASSGSVDPVGDLDAMPVPGLLHKYHGRALLVTTGACAIHCRYCFRRHFPYADSNPRKQAWRPMLDYLSDHDDIEEIILSGGDPLMLDNGILDRLIQAFEEIPHLRWLRIHTRLPVVLPARIDDGLIALLRRSRFRSTCVIHCNHANELMDDELAALQRMDNAGISLLNQSVLLKGVNDSAAALTALSRRLHQARVLPYYLHMLDPVQGAMHFEVAESAAVDILDTIRSELPGYLVPRLVREIPGEASKSAIFTI